MTKAEELLALREVLESAYRELKKHDADYQHRTSVDVNKKIVAALAHPGSGDAEPGAK